MGSYRQLAGADDPDLVATLRGRDPLVAATWEASVAAAQSPEEALGLAEQGLAYHPQHTRLLLMRLQVLGAQGRTGELIHAVRHSLAIGQPDINKALLHQALVDAHLQSDDPDAAHDEVLIFGSLSAAPPARVAELMARVALSYAFIGRETDADRALDESLASGTSGPARLLNDIARKASHRDAALELISRADARHPGHPDLQLYLVVENMERKELDAALAALDQMSAPLPPRLDSQVKMLRARVVMLQGHPDEALQSILERLDVSFTDPHALMVLLELKHLHGLPEDQEFLERLTRAASHPRGLPGPILQQIEATLQAQARAAGQDASAP